MPGLEDLSREELIALVLAQVDRIDDLVAANEGLVAANKDLAARLAKLEHLLSRNSGNSSMPPAATTSRVRRRRRVRIGGAEAGQGQAEGAPGANLSWADAPDDQEDRFPRGVCECGADLAGGADLGVVDSFQQIEIPQVAATVTQYDQHAVRCGCGKVHAAARPDGAGPGRSSTARCCRGGLST